MRKKTSPRSESTTPTFVFTPSSTPKAPGTTHATKTQQASEYKRESTTPTTVFKK